MKTYLLLIVFFVSTNLIAQNRDHAFQINEQLGRGINFGNMFEAPTETEWGNPWKPDYPAKIAELGFNHVRIPIRWETDARSSSTAPYTINTVFLYRIKQVVDSCLNNGLMAIINMHHHEALLADPDGQKARFLAQWEQIAEFFKDYPDELLFEILNEPNGAMTATKWNTFLVDALAKIRVNNPTRVVLIGTPEWGGLDGLPKLQIPDDDNIILTIHYYNPFRFTHQGAEWSDGADAWLGTEWTDTETERQVMRTEFAKLKSIAEQNNVPAHVGEFGSYNKADTKSRKKWTTFLARYIESQGWSWAYWEFSAGFGIYNPGSDTYNQFLVDALLTNPMPDPAYYAGTAIYTSNFASTIADWGLSASNGTSATKVQSSNQLQVQITTSGTLGYYIQLAKTGINLEAGKKYRVTFTASADASREMLAYTGMNKADWGAYSDYHTISLTPTPTEFSYTFDMTEDDSDARIVFDLGTSAEDVYFDSIVLESIELQEPSASAFIENVNSRIFPNPVQNKLIVDNRDDFQKIVISNLQGSIVLNRTLNNFNNEIDLSPLSSGIYFVSLQNQKNRFTTKIIKN